VVDPGPRREAVIRVLIVEDDARLAELLARSLREAAYAVDVAEDGERGKYLAAVNSYDAIILDVGLPRLSGVDVCRDLRARGSRVPVLMLTARDAVSDRVAGLDSGADDYLTKPFELEELFARLRALLRRAPEMVAPVFTIADLVVDTRSQRVERGGRPIALTTKEYAMCEYLARNAGRVIGRGELTDHVWDANHDPFSNAIEVYINRLRKKIDADGAVPLIHTRRGAGYIMAADAGDT
jgi:two-component system copper resistance phosphate regulon response regulator CusR